MGVKEDIGTRIRTMRLSRKWTQADLAKAIGQSASSITMYETGRREPEFEVLEAMADAFNVPLVALVSDNGGLSPDETRLITAYRSASHEARGYAMDILEKSAAERKQKETGSSSARTAS